MKPRFTIGTQFLTRGNSPRLCTVVDILTTYNAAGEIVRITYKATHEFMGQSISEEVVDTTVAMGVDSLARSQKKT